MSSSENNLNLTVSVNEKTEIKTEKRAFTKPKKSPSRAKPKTILKEASTQTTCSESSLEDLNLLDSDLNALDAFLEVIHQLDQSSDEEWECELVPDFESPYGEQEEMEQDSLPGDLPLQPLFRHEFAACLFCTKIIPANSLCTCNDKLNRLFL